MATDTLTIHEAGVRRDDSAARRRARSVLETIFAPLASLKLTVALFSLAIFLVFAGTLAQARYDVWQVLHQFFRTWVAWIPVQVFFPPAWFPSLQNVPAWMQFPFPGGFTIGALMAANLVAAHGLRFKLQAKGARLWAGLAVIAAGSWITWLVIVAGPNTDGSQATAPIEWITLWKVFLVGLATGCVAIAGALLKLDPARKLERIVLGSAGVALMALLAFLLFFVRVEALDPAAMRILWQLIKAESAALVLLAGCILAFRKRAGIVLLHAGVGLIMANELVVHMMHKETLMVIKEGETANYSSDVRTFELAVVDSKSSAEHDAVVVVPEHVLRESLAAHKPISHPDLPVNVEVVQVLDNSGLANLEADEKNAADTGAGLTYKLVERAKVTGADASDKVNEPAAYVKLTDKATGASLGTYALGVQLRGQPVQVGDKSYDVGLRYQRDYKPYSVHLYEVKRENYAGTDTPRSYSSEFQLVDPSRHTDRRAKIRMNEPLRYGGDTFYQTGNPDPETTVLSIVSNFGWMIPYMACMIVGTGLLFQFGLTLVRFLRRREDERFAGDGGMAANEVSRAGSKGRVATVALVSTIAAAMGLLIWSAIPPSASTDEFDLYSFGKLPVLMGGRVQPIDSMARNALRMISLREGYVDENGDYQPATRWLLDLVARPKVADTHRIFRIENPEVLSMLGLERRKYYRYSWAEVTKDREAYRAARDALKDRSTGSFSVYEKKLADLDRRVQIHELLVSAFLHRPFPKFPTAEEYKADPDGVMERLADIKERWGEVPQLEQDLADSHAPLAVPPNNAKDAQDVDGQKAADGGWQPYSVAWIIKYLTEVRGEPTNPATSAWEAIFDAYAARDPAAFNRAVKDYAVEINQAGIERTASANPTFETWFNYWSPFMDCQWLYFVAFCLAALAWLGWSGPLNRIAFWLIAMTFVFHLFALGSRMYISGRPPVTNLYSAALFIGSGAVLAGLIIEAIYRLGYGNIMASAAGFATLMIADKLSLVLDDTRGDTIGVMQAVLDTPFWLSTHVTTVNLGYAATFAAWLLGLTYVVRGVFTPTLSAADRKSLARMIYGTVCFGLFFSFVGTVLGGLWADDSWGRFWGWDPKENGALIIVLWNALVLHARWDGLVKDRGLAVLAMGGGIVTSWSMFGVNQLGVGLHSYGFTEGVLLALGIYCASQLLMIGLGCLPLRYWWSFRRAEAVG